MRNFLFKIMISTGLLLLLALPCFSQVVPPKDSAQTQTQEDKKFVESLERYKNKSKFNKLIHILFIKNPGTKKAKKTTERFGETYQNFEHYDGMPIRNIEIDTYDPFGYSLT